MNHRIPCEIIQDLMPMYADGLTSETTDREIRSHLEECETCREMYERMKAEMEGDASQTAGEPPEIDYLKKVRRKNVRNVVLAAAGVFLFMAAALFMSCL
jgi:predicted anti-sigma-YlaC factor YlaD